MKPLLGSSPWTTLLGFLVGALTYLQTSGATVPTTKADLVALGLSAALAGLGRMAADSK